jgi:hypothetical protein
MIFKIMERTPESPLAEMQRKDATLRSLINKRLDMLQSAQSWVISREDPDVEAAAKNHAARIVEVTIPEGISLLEEKRNALNQERNLYIQDNADHLVDQALAFEEKVQVEEKVVDRLKRELQRGFTTQEVVDRRISELESLRLQGDLDPELQVGLELLMQRRQADEESEKEEDTSDEEESATEDEQRTEEALPGDVIPSLLPLLDRITSMHEHKYNTSITVGKKEEEARAIAKEDRSPEQQQLLDDIETLRDFSRDSSYKNVYTPSELHELVVKLRLLSQKNRPDFNEVEDKILRLMEDKERVMGEGRSLRVDGASRRADSSRSNRRGMQWETLRSFAREASSHLRGNLYGTQATEMQRYLIQMRDPIYTTYPDLTEVYQVVADIHALDIIGKRSLSVQNARQETFVANCETVNTWYEEVKEQLQLLPEDPDIRKLRFKIVDMIETMNKRLEGKEKSGFNKDYRLDSAGAINLQKRIGYTVEELKDYLNSVGLKEDEGLIVPLE